MLRRLAKIDLIEDFVLENISQIEKYQEKQPIGYDPPLDGPNLTNAEIFRTYVYNYLKTRPDIHQDKMSLLVRVLSPSDTGLPIEVYAFTKTTEWEKYESIQAEVFDHLIAAAKFFNIILFQQPSGLDFYNYSSSLE